MGVASEFVVAAVDAAAVEEELAVAERVLNRAAVEVLVDLIARDSGATGRVAPSPASAFHPAAFVDVAERSRQTPLAHKKVEPRDLPEQLAAGSLPFGPDCEDAIGPCRHAIAEAQVIMSPISPS